MSKVKIRHYRIKRARGFWEPTPAMKRLGFHAVPCGTDGPDAWATAEEWNRRWDRTRRGEEPSPAMAAADNLSPFNLEELTVYPSRSLGEAFRRYRRTAEWSSKAPRTREDWWRCWRHIKPVFGDCNPRTVTLEDVSAWRQAIEETVSLREAHRCLKIWRALWKVSAVLGYCMRDADPSLGVRNRAAPGRSATWTEGEVARLYKRAWRDGYQGLAAVIAVAWSTQMSPGDVRALRASQLARGGAGAIFFTARGKDGGPGRRRSQRPRAGGARSLYRHARRRAAWRRARVPQSVRRALFERHPRRRFSRYPGSGLWRAGQAHPRRFPALWGGRGHRRGRSGGRAGARHGQHAQRL